MLPCWLVSFESVLNLGDWLAFSLTCLKSGLPTWLIPNHHVHFLKHYFIYRFVFTPGGSYFHAQKTTICIVAKNKNDNIPACPTNIIYIIILFKYYVKSFRRFNQWKELTNNNISIFCFYVCEIDRLSRYPLGAKVVKV